MGVCVVSGGDGGREGAGGGFRLGDDAVSYDTEAKGQYGMVPQGGGRQPLSRPDVGGSISFGSHAVDFSTSSGDAYNVVRSGSARSSGDGGRAAPIGELQHDCCCGVRCGSAIKLWLT